MQTHKFVGHTFKEAQDKMRALLGPEAVVLSNKKSGTEYVIIAMKDEHLEAITQTHAPAPTSRKRTPDPAGFRRFDRSLEMLPRAIGFDSDQEIHPDVTAYRQTKGSAAYDTLFADMPSKPQLDVDAQKLRVADRPSASLPAATVSPPAETSIGALNLPVEEIEVFEAEVVDESAPDESLPILPTALERFEQDVKKAQAITEFSAELLTNIQGLQELVRRQMLPRANQSGVYALLHQKLTSAGIQNDISERLLNNLPGEIAEKRMGQGALGSWLDQALSEQVDVMASPEIWWGGNLIMAVIGPSGVGKSTSLAKLAARFLEDNDPQEVQILSLDSDNPESLRNHSEILGVDFHLVESYQPLAEVLDQFRHKRLILIDTAGIGYRSRKLTEHLSRLCVPDRPVKVMMVLSAVSEADALEAMVSTFMETSKLCNLDIEECIVTKLDEAVRIGGLISSVSRHGLRVTYEAHGTDVFEDLHKASALSLVRHALAGTRLDMSLDAQDDAGLGGRFEALRASLLENVGEMTQVLNGIRREFKNAGFTDATRSVSIQSKKKQPYAKLVHEQPSEVHNSKPVSRQSLWVLNDYEVDCAFYNPSQDQYSRILASHSEVDAQNAVQTIDETKAS